VRYRVWPYKQRNNSQFGKDYSQSPVDFFIIHGVYALEQFIGSDVSKSSFVRALISSPPVILFTITINGCDAGCLYFPYCWSFILRHGKRFCRSCFRMTGLKWLLILVVQITIPLALKYGLSCTGYVCCPQNISEGVSCRYLQITTAKYSFC
jgi:hypothetical protein